MYQHCGGVGFAGVVEDGGGEKEGAGERGGGGGVGAEAEQREGVDQDL